jgi:hypothetical protein
MGIIQTNMDKIIQLCVNHKIDKLYVFGSAVSDSFNAKNDVDLLVSFQSVDLFNYFDN